MYVLAAPGRAFAEFLMVVRPSKALVLHKGWGSQGSEARAGPSSSVCKAL